MSLREALLRVPLVPIAVLATVGIVADRYLTVPGPVWPGVAAVGLLVCAASRKFAGIGLAMALTGLVALHHHMQRFVFPPDDIGFLVRDEPRLARIRGRLMEDVVAIRPAPGDPLRSVAAASSARALIDVEALDDEPVTGRLAATVLGSVPSWRAGTAAEWTGWLSRPRAADNPGEADYAAKLLDQRCRAVFTIRNVADGVADKTPSGTSAIAAVRAWANRHFVDTLPANEAAVASALLLGDGAAMTRDDWQRYIRTGVVHVLAVSGQHLAVLAGFAWLLLRGLGVSRRRGALAIALLVVAYAALTGGRPPILRAAVMAVAVCVALWLRRPARPGNTFALALLAVVLLNPADMADPGCQFSFLCVAVLIWGIARRMADREPDPLQLVIAASRPPWMRLLRAGFKAVTRAYVVTIVLGLAVMPLSAWRYNLISPVGILIGPPAIALAAVALVAGLAQLLLAAVAPPLVMLIAPLTRWSLTGLMALVESADDIPGGHVYVGTPPLWWVLGFYVMLALALWWPMAIHRPRWCTVAGLLWIALGLAATLHRALPPGLVVTFLAVGHGGATVLETPDGRVMLCDCGAMAGPDVTQRVIAPFLWHRGISKIDEMFLSHADLDHFNGVPALAERFRIGRVSVNPSFAAKPAPGVREVLVNFERAGIPVQTLTVGNCLTAGDVTLEVLHPPPDGPSGPENARSLVVLVRHAGHTIALTGDLDLAGQQQVLQLPPTEIDAWMAPHHGGRSANPPIIAAWARPRIAIAHNGPGEAGDARQVYEAAGAIFLGTWPHGAVTLTSLPEMLTVTTFRTRLQTTLP